MRELPMELPNKQQPYVLRRLPGSAAFPQSRFHSEYRLALFQPIIEEPLDLQPIAVLFPAPGRDGWR